MSSQRVAVITGGNKGVGFAIVRTVCKNFDGIVYLTARDEKRGLEAVEALKKEGLSPVYQQLDVDSLESIQKFKKFLSSTHGELDVLVNNAAIAYKNSATEPFAEQAEVTNRVNFFGTLNLCNELFPLLRSHARVVNVASIAGHLSRINGKEPEATNLRNQLADPQLSTPKLVELINSFISLAKQGTHFEKGWPNSAYSVSKVAVCALTRIQQRELDQARPKDNILVNAVHPGYVDTDMTSHQGKLTIDQGAVAPSWLALLPPDATGPKGAFLLENKTVADWEKRPN